MNDLNKALGEISSIRQQVARSTEFRGYGPATLAATGVMAILAAAAQALWVPDPSSHILSVPCHLDFDRCSGRRFDRRADRHAHTSHALGNGR